MQACLAISTPPDLTSERLVWKSTEENKYV